MKRSQSGVMLLEAVIAILIFSLGVLGVLGMQAMSISASRDAKYRADAALLAGEVLGKMWAGDRKGEVLKQRFVGDGAAGSGTDYVAWKSRVVSILPGVESDALPVISITPGAYDAVHKFSTASVVTVTVYWRAPNDQVRHQYQIIARII